MITHVFALPELSSFDKWATMLDLEMNVRQRHRRDEPDKWYASFQDVYLKRDGVIIGTFGEGLTPEGAVRDYAKRIRDQYLVYKPFSPTDRRELRGDFA